jgi:hypothetical protein
MDARIFKLSWKVKVAAMALALMMASATYMIYFAGLKLNSLITQISQLAEKNAKEKAAEAAAAKEKEDRKSGILPMQIYGEKTKSK